VSGYFRTKEDKEKHETKSNDNIDGFFNADNQEFKDEN
jgi:hypothetical protein